jgi:hypothetical protein
MFTGHESYSLKNVIHKKVVIQVHSASRMFIGFNSYDEFRSWYQWNPSKYRSFFEVIKEGKQKCRIDVDNKEPVDIYKIVQCLLKFLFNYFKLVNDTCNAIVCANVDHDDREIGKGYHIIVPYVMFESRKLVEEFVLDFVNEHKEFEWSRWIDCSVYKTNQMFRIIGCTKKGKMQWKKFIGFYKYDDLSPYPKDLLLDSMCSMYYDVSWYASRNITAVEVSQLPKRSGNEVPEQSDVRKGRNYWNAGSGLEVVTTGAKMTSSCQNEMVPNSSVQAVMSMLRAKRLLEHSLSSGWSSVTEVRQSNYVKKVTGAKLTNNVTHCNYSNCAVAYNESLFKVRKIVGNIVVLDSKRPYMCPNCKRVHTSENPYIIVKNNEEKFVCRRF